MERRGFNAVTALALLLGVASAAILYLDPESMRLTAALTGLSGFLLLGYARDRSVSLPNLSQVKVELNLAEQIFELLILVSLLVSGPVPKEVGLGILAALLFLKISEEQIANNLKMNLESGLGVSYRVYALIGLIAISSFNEYFLFYGSFVYLGIIVYDIFNVFYQFYENRQGVKLKNRILSN